MGEIIYKKQFHRETIDEIEEITGFDLFHNLPDRVETRVEAADGSPFWVGSSF